MAPTYSSRTHSWIVGAVCIIAWLQSAAAAIAPIVVSPTKKFDGDDGEWSTFAMSVGNPPQSFRVLASTLVPESWVVLQQGCSDSSNTNCADSRGGTFASSVSKTWNDQKTWSLAVEGNLGYSSSDGGNYGYDTLALQTPTGGVSLDHQVVAGIATTEFYLGHIGLGVQTPSFNNQSQIPLLPSLRQAQKIPSLSYSYTAGASYNASMGSLTLGGYDSSRFIPNDVAFGFAPSETTFLSVGVQGIDFHSGSSTHSLLPTAFSAIIDSTVAPLWLPNDTCAAFASAFGLTFDQLRLQYVINSTQHALNVKNNPVVTFRIGNLASGGDTVALNFPYAAFDLNFTDPTSSDTSPRSYFPLRQAARPDQYVLGRTFLQEAFLTVDYERRNFSLAQAISSTQAPSNVVSIVSPSDAAGNGGSSSNGSVPSGAVVASSGSSFPMGAIGGIVAAVVIIIIAVFLFLWWRRRRSRARQPMDLPPEEPPSTFDKQSYLPPAELDDRHERPQDEKALLRKPGAAVSVSSTSATPPTELDTPPIAGGAAPSRTLSSASRVPPYELQGTIPQHELHSRSTSMNSNDYFGTRGKTLSMDGMLAGPAESPVGRITPDLISRDGMTFEPGSPQSSISLATSVAVSPTSGAHLVSHNRGRSGASSPLRPRDSASSHGSTLVSGHGRDGAASPDSTNAAISESAFQSPVLAAAQLSRSGTHHGLISPIVPEHPDAASG